MYKVLISNILIKTVSFVLNYIADTDGLALFPPSPYPLNSLKFTVPPQILKISRKTSGTMVVLKQFHYVKVSKKYMICNFTIGLKTPVSD